MPRPRLHDLGELMDVAERMAVESGPAAVTVRALSQTAGVSNGAIYHAFGSRTALLGRVWLRAAQRFLALQQEAVASARGGIEAVVAAADSPARFLERQPASARFLLAVSREDLLGSGDIPGDLATELRHLDRVLTELFGTLSRAVFERTDREAVAVIRDCVVELPTALLLRGNREPDAPVRERLAAAIRAILALTPPAPT
ncbi:helix-turn-helix domain-containing protein [Nocardia sp. NPDC050697]|uniref:TetR/AcrR family transcriptional regulator n=1 Tax=Nocardia sp. NPDC050697 TaxID=3155158 RepID=UPI00340AE5FE